MNNKLKKFLIVISSMIIVVAFILLCVFLSNTNKKYKITFYIDNQIVEEIETNGNEIIILPECQNKPGYEFMGWFFDENIWSNQLTSDYYENKALNQNVNVYAYYKKITEEYDISFIIDDRVFDTITTAGNEVLSLPTPPIKDNYTFQGWFFDKNIWNNELTYNYYLNKPLNNNINVYAYYKENIKEYNISFMVDGEVFDTITTAGNESLSLPTPPIKDNYTFQGWYFDENVWSNKLTSDYYLTIALNNNISVYAYYKENEVKPEEFIVNFETNGGSTIDPITTSLIETSPVTIKTNYTFKGWYLDATFTQMVNFPFKVEKNTTLYAKWEQDSVQEVTYTVNSSNAITGIESAPEGEYVLNIPSQINGKTITSIELRAFKDNSQIIKVVIPDSIKTIAMEAFWGCKNLKEVILPNSLTSISTGLFEYCSSLTSITIPDSVQSISADAFLSSGITSISLPDNLTNISQYAFKNCTNLQTVNLNNVEILDTGAFYACSNLQSIVIPKTIKSIAHHVFTDSALNEITIEADDATVYSTFIDRTPYYKNPDNWENGGLYVGKYLISSKSDFSENTFTIKDGTTVIANLALTNTYPKTTISNVVMPDSIKIIGEGAFKDLTNLKTINIPDNVLKIGKDAFSNTGILDNNTYWYENGLYLNHFLIAVKNVAMESFTMKEGTTRIIDGQLFGSLSSSITTLNLSSNLIYIGTENFKETKITTITLPSTLENIGQKAFYLCSNLTSVDTSNCNNLKSILYSAFSGCNISEIYIPQSVSIIEDCAFNNNKLITINCQASSKPDGWVNTWSQNYNGQTTVNWNVSSKN